jgi:hypothetical protein
LQLQPVFLLLSSGPKKISLNGKKRGFPTGLRVMSSSEASTSCLLEVDSALETARFRGVTMTILKVEVWGCGGERAAERQQKMKEWEKQLILKRRKVIIESFGVMSISLALGKSKTESWEKFAFL